METRSNHILVGGVTLALLAALAAFIVWIAGIGSGATKDYDIFFKQSVEGLDKGSSVTFAGVPSGTVREIALWKDNPEFVRVRIALNDDVPVLVGTTAAISGVGFTGVSQIQLSGAMKGAPPITEPGPAGVPSIPTRTGGLGALLNNAPQLVERLSTLTERLTELLSDKNQNSITSILANVDKVTGHMARGGPDLEASMRAARVTIEEAGVAAKQLGELAGSTNALVNEQGKPMVADLRKTVIAVERSMANLDAALAESRPGLRALSTQTLPEIGQLVRDLRAMSESLGSVANKIDQQGAGALLGGTTLPDYKPGRSGQ